MRPDEVVGSARVVDASGFGFPDSRLVDVRGTLAEVGRLSWFNVFLGRGMLVVLPNGTRWRVGAAARSRWVCPVVVDERGGAVARSGPGDANYGISTREHAYSLNPATGGSRRAQRWTLHEYESEVAVFERQPFTVMAAEPVALGVVVLARVLCAFGVLGERDLMPRMQPQ